MAILDNYLPCETYAGAPASEAYPGFNAWFDADTNHYYFAVVTNLGRVVLRSEAYTTEAARNNGIESVMKNRDLEERFRIVQDEADGLWYVVLRAGNNQEIARSCPYADEAAAQAGIAACASTYTERKPRTGIVDNYLPVEAYAAAPDSEKNPGYKTWYDEATGLWYFAAVTTKGRVQLRSEGYTTESARDNGIESVMKNRDLEARYKVIQDENDGLWYLGLRAGNNQEIARSGAFESEEMARKGIVKNFSTFKERDLSNVVVDNYLPCETYAAAPDSEKYSGFKSWFDADTQSHYFAAVTDAGRVVLRSEAYTTESARNNGIESVIKNRDLEARYKTVQDEDDKQWYVVLRAGNNQEIARSCPYANEALALAGIAHCFSTYTERGGTTEPGVVEDYLPCEAYASKKHTEYKGFTAFQDETNGLYYFAMVDTNGNVVLRSEGYTTEAGRDNGIESVINNRDIRDRWNQNKDETGYYMSLRAGNGLEIARTCPFESEGAMLGWWMPFAAAWPWGGGLETTGGGSDDDGGADVGSGFESTPTPVPPVTPPAPPKPPVVPPKPPVPPVVPPKTPVPPVTNYSEAAATGGGKWWKWLLGALLLGALLFLLLRGCDGCSKSTPPPPIPDPHPPIDKPDTTRKQDPTPPPAPAATCNCTAQTDPVFAPRSGEPKSLTRLGTNPEFGNSHGLTPEQFLTKLQTAAKNNAGDKRFLDRMFKAMGYTDFTAAKADQFTATTVPVGTIGNMGRSKQHETVYAQLNTSGLDLEAFRIKAANGCDLHFMKTCGNHFFYCQK